MSDNRREIGAKQWPQLCPQMITDASAERKAEIVSSGALAMRPITYEHSWATEGDPTSHPSDDQTKEVETRLKDVPIGNPVMLHTIQLLQLVKQLDDNSCQPKPTRDSVPHLEVLESKITKSLDIYKDKNFNQKAVKELMRRAVVIITVFHGYDLANKSAIDLLIDILSEYLSRLCQTIRKTSDSLELRSSNDFIDIIDRVFHDMNVSDFESLRQYDSDIRLYNQNIIKEVNRKIGTNESMDNVNKMNQSFQSEAKVESNDPIASVSAQPEPTLTLKSLLNSFKSGSTEDNHIFDLTPSDSALE